MEQVMLIEYYATWEEDDVLEERIKHFHIQNAFNPEEGYFVLETDDERVLTVMRLMGIEMYVTDTQKSWLKHQFGTDDIEPSKIA